MNKNDEKELFGPCPFCGSELKHKSNCYLMRIGQFATVEERVIAWNTRPIEDALSAQVAQLTGAAAITDLRVHDAETEVARLTAELETMRLERNYRPRMDEYERLTADNARLASELAEVREAGHKLYVCLFESTSKHNHEVYPLMPGCSGCDVENEAGLIWMEAAK
jgi:hypothetical protein